MPNTPTSSTILALALALASLLAGCPTDTEKDTGTVDTAPPDLDGDGRTGAEDCDDENAEVHVDAAERCDDLDNDCDGEVDEDAEDTTRSYVDADGDGYGDEDQPVEACGVPEGNATQDGDCNDSDAAYNPAAEENDCGDPADYNCDGSVGYRDADGDGSPACYDCNDGNPHVSPDAEESCNGVDDDCDNRVDVGSPDGTLWYRDGDGDGYGGASTLIACDQPAGYERNGGDCRDDDTAFNPGVVETDCADPTDYNCDGSVAFEDADGDGAAACEDCNDADREAFPDAAEVCNGKDDDCDGTIDEAGTFDGSVWYADADGDFFGDAATTLTACDQPAGYVVDATDCDDTDAAENPGAPEMCDGDDDNCDGAVDEATAVDAPSWYVDLDTDGYGDPSTAVVGCEGPADYIVVGDDCNDADAAVNPDATEVCDGIDNDCDGTADNDDAADASTWYADVDGDFYGDPATAVMSCEGPAGYILVADDCDDADVLVYPGVAEVCDGVDNDCDGTSDNDDAVDASTWYADADADGYGDPAVSAMSCDAPAGYVADWMDCDDANDALPDESGHCPAP